MESLHSYSTAALVEELQQREGVKAIDVAPYKTFEISHTEPVVILIVED